jgi:Mg-chelatase subunit ChlD
VSDDATQLLRWRLALGSEADGVDPRMGLEALCGQGQLNLAEACALESAEDADALDETLDFVYGGRLPRGLTAYIPRWLERVRRFFDGETIALVQKDAIEKKGLTRLLFEPETLPYLDKNVDLVATLLAARALVPDEAKEIARGIVREVVEELRKKLETEARTSVLGAVRRNSRSPLKVARNLDWKRTIAKNLHTWDREQKRLVPERFHFLANQRRQHEWDISILVDQSGSMAVSVIYSAIMAAIFASIDVLKTRLAYFNHEVVVDMTPMLADPVDILFSAQLGGAEDFNRAIAFAQEHYIERPEKSLLILITDLYHTAGDTEQFLARVQQLVDSKVKVMVLLKLSDAGKPSFDQQLAARLTALGVHCFGATPKLLIQVVERIMKNQPYDQLIAEDAR